MRPGLRGLQPTGVEYRGFYLPPSIGSISGPVRCATNQAIDIGHRNPVYADRNLVSVSWPEQPPEFGLRPGSLGLQPIRIEYRGIHLPAPISSMPDLVSASWPKQPPNFVCGLDYMACSLRDSNIGGFISRPPSAASLAPDRNRAPESFVRRPKFGVRPGLHGLQPTGVEYRRFYLPPAEIGHRKYKTLQKPRSSSP